MLKIALVGCGAVSRLFYAPALKEVQALGKGTVACLIDPSVQSRLAVAEMFPDAEQQSDLSNLPAQIDLAIVASPPGFHASQAIQLLERGVHVLCEKPMATSPSDCACIIGKAKATGRCLAVGHYKRFFPTTLAIKEMVRNEVFGKLRHIEVFEGGKFAWPAATDSFFRKSNTAGGVLFDIGPHVFDLLLFWLGKAAETHYTDDSCGGQEANAWISLRWPEGTTAAIHLSRDWETENCSVFTFEKATIHHRVNRANELELTLNGIPATFAAQLRAPLDPFPCPPSPALDTNPQAFIRQLINVCDAITTSSQPLVTGEDGLAVMQWIHECYTQRRP